MADNVELTPAQKKELKKEKMKRLQRDRPDPVAEEQERRKDTAEREKLAADQRAAEEAAAKAAADEKAAEEAAAAAAAAEEAAQQEALRKAEEDRLRAIEEYEAAEERKKVLFGRRDNFGTLSRVRDSSLLQGSYMRYLVVEDNWKLAERERVEREELLYLKDENAAEWSSRGKLHAQERLVRQKHSKQVKKELEERSRRQAREARKALETGRLLLQQQREAVHKEMRERVRAEKNRVSTLDAREEAARVDLRQEGTQRRQEIAKAVANMRRRMRIDKRKVAAQIRNGFVYASHSDLTDQAIHDASRRADKVRQQTKKLEVRQSKEEQAYVAQARQKRDKIVARREHTRQALFDSAEEHKAAASDLRATIVGLKADARRHDPGKKLKRMVTDVYRSRFASKQAAEAFDNSDWRSLTGFYKKEPWATGTSDVMSPSLLATLSLQEVQGEEELLEA